MSLYTDTMEAASIAFDAIVERELLRAPGTEGRPLYEAAANLGGSSRAAFAYLCRGGRPTLSHGLGLPVLVFGCGCRIRTAAGGVVRACQRHRSALEAPRNS